MKFRTEVDIAPSERKLKTDEAIFSIGSCFASEMSSRLADGQLQTLNNPFGTIFNPWAVNNALEQICQQKTYTEEDLVLYHGEFLSLHHHTSFNSGSVEVTLGKINQKIAEAYDFLRKTSWVIITYGTAYAYEFLPQGVLAANCHKIPQKFFKKRLLTHEELTSAMEKSIQLLTKFCSDDVQILLTLSPVRHAKDGLTENSLSKAKLLCAMHETAQKHPQCIYLPIYEIMMDDLRDYRFYKEDMLHPSPQAVQYIWEKFAQSYFDAETLEFISENFKIKQALEHRPKDENSPQHQDFLNQIKQRIAQQQGKVKHSIFIQH